MSSKTPTKLRAQNTHLIIQRVEQESTTASGIVLAEQAVDIPAEGRVVHVSVQAMEALGWELTSTADYSKFICLDHYRATVLYKKYAGVEVKDGDELYYIIDASDVLATRKGKEYDK